jgi:hypothetical protein
MYSGNEGENLVIEPLQAVLKRLMYSFKHLALKIIKASSHISCRNMKINDSHEHLINDRFMWVTNVSYTQ